MKEDYLLFHPGNPNAKTAMANFNMLNYDDFIDFRMKVRFEKKLTNSSINEEKDKLNAFMIQFLPHPSSEVAREKSNDVLKLHGLVITLVSHDSDSNINKNNQTYFLTHRFFPELTTVTRDYLGHLFERMTKHEGCYFDNMSNLTDMRITVDYEKKDELVLFYKKVEKEEWVECFTIQNVSKFITKTRSFIQLQQSTGKLYSLSTEIHEIKLLEKHHRLDLDENLHVSHDLVEEIFDKVQNFGKIFEDDEENLKNVQTLQNQLMEKSQLLYIYSKDLNRGSRKFQEYMLESLNKHRMINPLNMPKMQAIKSKIEQLQEKQGMIFDRFNNIIDVIKTKNVIKKTFHNFKKIDKIIALTIREISSDQFKQFVNKTKKLMKVLKKSDFDNFIQKLESASKANLEHVANVSSYGMWIIIAICLCVGGFTFVILRSISQANKSHFN